MRRLAVLLLVLVFALDAAGAEPAPARESAPVISTEQSMLRRIFTEALAHGTAYENLRELVTAHPGRLSGSKSLEGAVVWAEHTLNTLGLDRVTTQDVMVPHWERGAPESVQLLSTQGPAISLAATALGGSDATPAAGITAEVIELHSLTELATLGREKIAGKIVFFNRPMDPAFIPPGLAYGEAGDQRNRGPAAAAQAGAVATLTRSLTHAHDDIPHTGTTAHPPGGPTLPAAALSANAADRLSTALSADPHLHVEIKINSVWLPDAHSKNVIGEIRGSEFPDQILLVGGHLDSWDIAPGAHDDGAGVVQSIEVMRLFRALGLKPRHTLRVVLFTNEENGGRGATVYADAARKSSERHLLALESDNGGFQPRGFRLGSSQFEAPVRASRWSELFAPYGLYFFEVGRGGADVAPLFLLGAAVGEISPDSQRYFDLHHTAADSLDKVNSRELHLGAAALASLLWLVDTQGF